MAEGLQTNEQSNTRQKRRLQALFRKQTDANMDINDTQY